MASAASHPSLQPSRLARATRRVLDLALGTLVVTVVGVLVAGWLPALAGGTALVLRGPSMEPALRTGELVAVMPIDAAAVHVGDVVSLRPAEGAIITHRVSRLVDRPGDPRGERWLETKGDANPAPDPAIIPASTLIGRVAWSVPLAGYALAVITAPVGLALLLGLASTLVIGARLLDEPGRSHRPSAAPSQRAAA
jgi:signal peptidase I